MQTHTNLTIFLSGYEHVGNYSWGPKDSGRRNARTGGREKLWITVVLAISKCGKKLIPFIIFKGMTFLFTIDDILQLKIHLNFFSLASDT